MGGGGCEHVGLGRDVVVLWWAVAWFSLWHAACFVYVGGWGGMR